MSDIVVSDAKRIEDKLDQILDVLNNPHNGMAVRIDRLEQFLKPMGLGGSDEEKGILARVSSLEKFKSDFQSFVNKFIIPIAVTESLVIIGFIAAIMTHQITIDYHP